jgi:RNA polymerase sigma-70 factor (ECF subfamily)
LGVEERELKSAMLASIAGDASAHRALLTGLAPLLRAYFKRRLFTVGRDAVEAEDLMQETLLAIHTRRHTYRPSEPLTPWVHAVARYKLIDHLRRTDATARALPIEDAETVFGEDDHAAVESALDLARLMRALPEKMRTAIKMVKLDGLTVAEAARRTGMSEPAVKVSVHRGLKAIAAAIEGARRR